MHSTIALVVEDEESVRHLTARILEDAGFHALEAHSAEAALELLASHPDAVQLVVSDVTMPGIGGLRLAEMLAEAWPSTRILLISGRGAPGAEYRGPFLAKPFTVESLLDALAAIVPLPSAHH
ncbi:MAG TPA: response regulator [Gemmatimonadales bacterium]|nr:response regulator [Gemmatimonadales bacterium]